MKKIFIILFLAVLACNANAQGVITTVAGIGTQSFGGDDGPAIDAGLFDPTAVIFDNSGNFYISDGYNNRIRKVDTAGIITTIAGTGTAGYNGDSIPATDAEIYTPIGLAFDAAGNLYVTDPFNYRIRRIDAATGIITTVAGTGTPGYNGDGIAATAAELNNPHGVAVDAAGNIYITEYDNHRIRKVNTSGIISTIAGTGIAGYSGDGGPADTAQIDAPYGITVDNSGNVYFADDLEGVVRKIDPDGIITTFAGLRDATALGDNGPADSASIDPAGLALDGRNNLYIADINPAHSRIRKVDAATHIITTVAGNGSTGYNGDDIPATDAKLGTPTGAAFDLSGNLYIADFGSNRIRMVTPPEGVPVIAGQRFNVLSYPNPCKGNINITVHSTAPQAKVTLTDILGQRLIENTIATNTIVSIPLALPPGIYTLIVTANNNRWSEKVIVDQ